MTCRVCIWEVTGQTLQQGRHGFQVAALLRTRQPCRTAENVPRFAAVVELKRADRRRDRSPKRREEEVKVQTQRRKVPPLWEAAGNFPSGSRFKATLLIDLELSRPAPLPWARPSSGALFARPAPLLLSCSLFALSSPAYLFQ